MNVMGGPIKAGDRVTVVPGSKNCGRCYYCLHVPGRPTLCSNRKIYGFGNSETPPYLNGDFAEYTYIPRQFLGVQNARKHSGGNSRLDRTCGSSNACCWTRVCPRFAASGRWIQYWESGRGSRMWTDRSPRRCCFTR